MLFKKTLKMRHRKLSDISPLEAAVCQLRPRRIERAELRRFARKRGKLVLCNTRKVRRTNAVREVRGRVGEGRWRHVLARVQWGHVSVESDALDAQTKCLKVTECFFIITFNALSNYLLFFIFLLIKMFQLPRVFDLVYSL